MTQDFDAIRNYVLLELMPKRKLTSGTVFAFSDDRFAEFTLQRFGITTSNPGGQPYQDGITAVVDRLLDVPNVVAFGLGSRKLYEHLQQTGRFDYDGALPVRYHRGEKSFEVF